MGGTSTDVCLVLDGRPAPAAERVVGGFAVRVPSLDVHTIGAGGGSIAQLDPGGALLVGPRSAGAVPGPACYGRGGTEATVTDADLVAGHIPADVELPGLGRLDLAAARAALDAARRGGRRGAGRRRCGHGAGPSGQVSVERGVDPRGLALVAFGGAGPLHACALADALGHAGRDRAGPGRRAVGRRHPGRAAAGRPGRVVPRSTRPRRRGAPAWPRWPTAARVAVAGRSTRRSTVGFDCRYVGQSHELRVERIDGFHAEHERRNGYARIDTPVEVVAVRATARVASPVDVAALDAPARPATVGPACHRRARLHDLGPGRLAGRSGCRRRPGADAGAAVSLDPASLQILVSRLAGVAEEMSAVLRRAAFSPNIKERADCSAALFTADGELLAQAENIPVHLGSMPASVRAAIDRFGPAAPAAERIAAGEQIVLNDPFAGGTHLNDITVVAPCFAVASDGGGRLVGWVATRAHHADVGGAAPGSLPADATDMFSRGAAHPAAAAHRRGAGAAVRQLTHADRAGRRPRRPGRRQRVGAARLAGPGRCAARRGARLRRAPHAGRVGGAARRAVAVHRRDRQLRPRPRPAGAVDHRGRR